MPFSRFKQFLDNRMIKELSVQGSKVVKKAQENASWSSSIPNAISLGEAKKTSNGYEIEIKVDAREDGPAPHAAAFEYGSGEHSEEGQKYIISPKEKQALAFEWEPAFEPWGSRKFIGKAGEKYLFRFVEHPGVEARPYLRPAIESTRAGFVTSLAKILKQSYLDSTVRVTVISAKK